MFLSDQRTNNATSVAKYAFRGLSVTMFSMAILCVRREISPNTKDEYCHSKRFGNASFALNRSKYSYMVCHTFQCPF